MWRNVKIVGKNDKHKLYTSQYKLTQAASQYVHYQLALYTIDYYSHITQISYTKATYYSDHNSKLWYI